MEDDNQGGTDKTKIIRDIIVDKIKKKIMVWIAPAIPYILGILGGIIVIVLTLSCLYYLFEKIEVVYLGFDKFVNLTTGSGWSTSEESFWSTLKDEYDRYGTFKDQDDELDIELLASTVHYKRLVNPDDYGKNSGGLTTYTYDESNPLIQAINMQTFYQKAKFELGSSYSLNPLDKKLTAHLIGSKITLECFTKPESFDETVMVLRDEIKPMFDNFYNNIKKAYGDTFMSNLNLVNRLKLFYLIASYSKQDSNYFKTQLENLEYTAQKDNIISGIMEILNNSDFTNNCVQGQQIPFPVISHVQDYEVYKDYLRKVYLPLQPYNDCTTCEYRTIEKSNTADKEARMALLIDRQISEIFEVKNTFAELTGKKTRIGGTIYVPGLASLPLGGNSIPWSKIGRDFYNNDCYKNGKIVEHPAKPCPHRAIDFGYWPITTGTPVYAIANGTVIAAGWTTGGAGNSIKLGHDIDQDGKSDYYSSYSHLSKILVQKGDSVGGSQKIGEVGSTGNSSGPHLHFVMEDKNRNRIDPAPILKGIIAGTSELNNEPTSN